MNLNHLITPYEPLTCSNTTTHHKTNFQHHKYRVLQVFKSYRILFITSNQQYLFKFARNEKHFQYEFKPPYNIMQATRLLQHNNHLKTNFQHHKYRVLQVFKSNKIYSSHLINNTHSNQQPTRKPITNITTIMLTSIEIYYLSHLINNTQS